MWVEAVYWVLGLVGKVGEKRCRSMTMMAQWRERKEERAVIRADAAREAEEV